MSKDEKDSFREFNTSGCLQSNLGSILDATVTRKRVYSERIVH